MYTSFEGSGSAATSGGQGSFFASVRKLSATAAIVPVVALGVFIFGDIARPGARLFVRSAVLLVLVAAFAASLLISAEGADAAVACARVGAAAESSPAGCLAVYARTAVAHFSIVFVLIDVPLSAVAVFEFAR